MRAVRWCQRGPSAPPGGANGQTRGAVRRAG